VGGTVFQTREIYSQSSSKKSALCDKIKDMWFGSVYHRLAQLRLMWYGSLGSASLLMATGDNILPFNRYTYDLRLFYYSFYYFWLINYIPVKYV
jgi:hypothetical protein